MTGRLIGILISLAISTTAVFANDLTLRGSAKWLVLASSESLVEVDSLVNDYSVLGDLRIVRARNGRFALVSGPLMNFDIEAHKKNGTVKPDAFLSSGENLLETVLKIEPEDERSLRISGCAKVNEDTRRLACYDATAERQGTSETRRTAGQSNPEPQADRATSPAGSPELEPRKSYTAEQAAVPTAATLKQQRQDFDQNIMHDRIELRVSFRNGWTQKIVGVAHRFRILNAFGDELHQGRDNLDILIPGGETVASPMFYVWENNPFIAGEPYDRLLGAVTNGTYKVELTVEKVVLGDGSVLEVSKKRH